MFNCNSELGDFKWLFEPIDMCGLILLKDIYVEWIKLPATKTNNFNLIPRTHAVEGEDWLSQFVLSVHTHTYTVACTSPTTHMKLYIHVCIPFCMYVCLFVCMFVYPKYLQYHFLISETVLNCAFLKDPELTISFFFLKILELVADMFVNREPCF